MSLADMTGPSAYSDEEIADLRILAWTQQKLLIVSPDDDRLSENEAWFLTEIAERLYGSGP